MKLLIDIPEHIYEHAKEESEDSRDEFEAMRAIANGSLHESCDDAISRQAVIELCDVRWLDDFAAEVRALPSVNPQQRTGRWKAFTHSAYHGNDEDGEPIWREVTVYHCNLCNRRTVIKEKYCPNCGCKM